MTIPSRIIEGIYNSELNAEKYYSIYGKENIEQALEELKKSNMEILNKYSSEDMKAAVMAKLNKEPVKNTSKSVKASFKAYKIISYAAAAVFVAAIAVPVGINSYKAKTPAQAATTRLKGPEPVVQEANLSIYCQKGKEIQALSTGDTAKEGDVLQITYQAGKNEYGVIFSVDGNGNITRHFPESSWTSGKLKHGTEEIPLDFSYELDAAPDYEYFIMVTGKEQFSMENLEKKIKNAKNLNDLTKLSFLPKHTEAKTFLIKK